MTSDFVPLLDFENDYEIMIEYPNVIRKKTNGKILKETINGLGYYVITINEKTYSKHRLIALQFIPNPNNFSKFDHINHIKTDNRIENLRWCDSSINCKNKSKYNGYEAMYVDELPENIEIIDEYNGWEFENYYIDHDLNIYYDTGANYRILYKVKGKYVNMRDVNNKKRLLSIKKLSRQFL